ncbi:hypothetical protein TL16_g08541 [Triparma laevis f. inornata]|nr:hypothetical protein TL16_g08541 [Triparma laevis f. inornata]
MRKEGAIHILAQTDSSMISPTNLKGEGRRSSSGRSKARPRVVSRETISSLPSSAQTSPITAPIESIEDSKLYNKIVNANNSKGYNQNIEINEVARQLMRLKELGRRSPRAGGEGFLFIN